MTPLSTQLPPHRRSRSARRCSSIERAAELERSWLDRAGRGHRRAARARRRRARRLVGRDRARPHACSACRRRAEARGEPGRRRGRPDRARAHLVRDAGRATASRPARSSLTLADTEERRRYLNARATIATLLEMRAVPVVNENDTMATTRDPLRRQRPPRRARRHHDRRRPPGPVLRRRRPLHGAAGEQSRRARTSRSSSASRRRSRRWPAAPARSCRAAACTPRSRPA